MSVFVDIAPDEAAAAAEPVRTGQNPWRGRLTRAALPLLSIVVFLGAWQLAAATKPSCECPPMTWRYR